MKTQKYPAAEPLEPLPVTLHAPPLPTCAQGLWTFSVISWLSTQMPSSVRIISNFPLNSSNFIIFQARNRTLLTFCAFFAYILDFFKIPVCRGLWSLTMYKSKRYSVQYGTCTAVARQYTGSKGEVRGCAAGWGLWWRMSSNQLELYQEHSLKTTW